MFRRGAVVSRKSLIIVKMSESMYSVLVASSNTCVPFGRCDNVLSITPALKKLTCGANSI